MANVCDFALKAVSKDKAALERLKRIMSYKDSEYHLHGVYEISEDAVPAEVPGSGLWKMVIVGSQRWSCWRWMNAVEKDTWSVMKTKEILLPGLCKTLDVGIETWSSEPNMAIQEHILVDHEGNVVANDSEDWDFEDDSSGFEDFEEFRPEDEIYGNSR